MRPSSLKSAWRAPWQRTLWIIFLAQLITAVGFSSIFPFLPLYVKSLGSSAGFSVELLAGLVFSAQALTMMVASPIWGMLADRYGRKLMVERAMFGGSVILLLMAFVQSAEQLVLLRAVQGLITGTVAASNALVASEAPRERTGYAMGLLQVGLGSGVALGPLIGGAVADAYGYAAAFYVTAALLFLAGVLVWAGVREDFVPRQAVDGDLRFRQRWLAILAAPGVAMTYGMRFMSQLGRMMVIPILPLFVEELLTDLSRVNSFTGLLIGAGSATTTVGAIYLGRLGDRVGHRRIVIASALFGTLVYFPLSLVQDAWQLLVLMILVGLVMGGLLPSISALLAGFSRGGEEGAVYGLDNSVRAGARAAAPIIGAGVALWFGLRASFVAAAGLYLLAALLGAWRLPKEVRVTLPEPTGPAQP